MRGRSRALAVALAMLMTLSCLAVLPVGSGASSRALINESEPNDDYATANLIQAGDIVHAGLDWGADDRNDVYKIAVAANDILNVSFVQWQFNPANTSEFKVDIEVLGPLPTHALIRAETKLTRVDHVSAFCIEPGEYFIWIYTWSTSKPVNYTLNADITPAQEVGPGKYYGTLDATDTVSGTNPYKWYKVNIQPNKGMQVTLSVPQNCDFDLFALLQWDRLPYFYPGHKNPLWLNASTDNATGNFEFLRAEAYEGVYYLKLKAWPGSKGSYELTIAEVNAVNTDGNNKPDEAIVIDRKGTRVDYLDQAFDHFDWYKLLLTKDDIINITFELLTHVSNVYNLSIYDQMLNYITGVFDTVTGNYYNSTNPVDSKCELENWQVPASGYYYVLVMPVRDPSWWGQKTYTNVYGKYQIEWDLPNLGPENTLDIPSIAFDEDTQYTGLDLDDYFEDPEGDTMTYTVTWKPENLTVFINVGDGTVTMTPAPNWNSGGDPLTVTFRADDPMANTGRLFDTADAHVSVDPVNDPPFVKGSIPEVTIDEDQVLLIDTNLYDVFGDIDDDTLGFTATDQGKVTVQIDNATGEVTVGPSDKWYGTRVVNITATDSGDESRSVEMSVKVNHVNHPPEAADGIEERSLTIKEDQTNTSIFIETWFTDADKEYTSDSLTITVGNPTPMNLMATIESGFLKVVPLKDWSGTDNVWVVARDQSLTEAKVKLVVTVTPVNDAPMIKAKDPTAAEVSANEGMNVIFDVVEVVDVDTNLSVISYTWYLDGEELGETTSRLNLSTDFDPGTAAISAGEYAVKVVVSDGELTDEFEWNLTVLNVNQGPENVRILSPQAGEKFKFGAKIVLEADNATDLDGDTLKYTWKDNATGDVLGQNRTLELSKLKKGTHVILLEVSDGKGGKATATVEFTVKPKKKTEPGFGAIALLAALAVAVSLIGRRRRRK